MSGSDSERYWDERARENPLYFVDTGVDYAEPDADAFWRRGEDVVSRMLALVGLSIEADESVLDIGCGVGRLTRALAGRAGQVYGIDVSREMLRLAEEYNPHLSNVTWLHGDGTSLRPVGDAAVDGCFSHVVFQHVPEPSITLSYVREMGRVLRPGGWALFQISTDPQIHRPRGGLRAWIRAGFDRRRLGVRDRAWWGSHVEVETLRAVAGESRLEIERLHAEGTQYTTVFARRRSPGAGNPGSRE